MSFTPTTASRETDALNRAVAHLDRNEIGLAEEILSRLLAASPSDAPALQLVGEARRMQGRFAEAEDFFRRSLALDPDQPHVHHNLANLLRLLRRFDEAIAEQREAIRLKPNYVEAHLNLALAFSDKGDHEEALKICRHALRIQPNYLFAKQTLAAELCALNRPKEAEQLLRQTLALGIHNERQAAALEHNLAVALKQQNQFTEALTFFDSARARAPGIPAVDYNRGNALQHLGRLEEAVESYRAALARNPLDLAAHEELNQLLYRLGDDRQFLRSYDEAALLYPGVGELALHKGDFLYLRGEFEPAREAFRRAAALLPRSVTPHDGLALVLARLNEFDAAIAEHEMVLRMEPDNAHGWRNYAQTLLAAGDARKALVAAERAVGLEPESQIALAIWGLALRALGDPREESMNDVERLVRIYEIGAPEGYGSMEDFNRELNAWLDRLHRDRRECIDQTLRMGTQTLDNLFGTGHAPVELLRARIDEAVADYVKQMPDDADHPLYRRRRNAFDYSASWSSRLHDCGYHTNHVHPRGWISSAYYVAVPDAVEDSIAKQGWIKFGEPNLPSGIADPVRRAVQPRPGTLVLFPSYLWHGTVPFRSAHARTTIAFDAVPR
ncbi:MAG TPA: tetratricopeptide repeat protein [Rhizomicrobium sp.]|jgi:tetratricopeptide (TPR) repeat protein|nr:tetratricopeptide repeat protein [Rhizomicrobium sp.]